jgi:hypothetical protein
MATELHIYVVTDFGCNSSHNDMYPPMSTAFMSKEKAYEFYNKLKNSLLKGYDDEPIAKVIEHENGETVIQDGDQVKRPQGVSIQYVLIN